MKPIPIKSAKEISKEFEVPEVVIFGYDPQTGKQHVTTYGKTIDQCKDAARAGNYLKKALGWPAELCNAEPSRAKKQQDELTRLRAEVDTLRAENERLHAQRKIVDDKERHRVHEWYHGKLASLKEWARKQPDDIRDSIFACLANGSPSVFESAEFSQKLNSLKYALELAEKENMDLKAEVERLRDENRLLDKLEVWCIENADHNPHVSNILDDLDNLRKPEPPRGE